MRDKQGWNPAECLETFFAQGFLAETLFMVRSGKEATVLCGRLTETHGGELVAAKVYRPREHRGFKNDAVYRQGRHIADARLRRSVANGGSRGKAFLFSDWRSHEATALSALYAIGVSVPRLITSSGDALLMGFVGDETGAAPRLIEVELESHEATRLYKRLLYEIETMLHAGHVHGDLSPFNILYWQGRVTIIDVPQTVDPFSNPDAFDLLLRDVTNVCEYFIGQGAIGPDDPERITRRLWHHLRYKGVL